MGAYTFGMALVLLGLANLALAWLLRDKPRLAEVQHLCAQGYRFWMGIGVFVLLLALVGVGR